jgi:hypothetical protein
MIDWRTAQPPQITHHQSHDCLLRGWSDRDDRALDAIVVPASRPAYNLVTAFELGATLGTTVIVLASHRTCANEAAALADDVPGLRCAVVDLSNLGLSVLPTFQTSRSRAARLHRLGDLSVKRNLGLVLGRLVGWRALMFLDDDLRDLDPDVVEQAVGGLGERAAVGIRAKSFPDNSVVCHARRAAGHQQGVFVSGAALMVDCQQVDSFFPDTYNEDWFFLAPLLDSRRVGAVGKVRQLPYNPFADVGRAAAEEFGEVLAEGLIGLLHTTALPERVPAEYWTAFVRCRKEFIRGARTESTESALDAAGDVLAGISPDELSAYVDAWRQDLVIWRDYLEELPRIDDLAGALNHLDLTHSGELAALEPRPAPLPARRPATATSFDPVGPNHALWVAKPEGEHSWIAGSTYPEYRPVEPLARSNGPTVRRRS